MYEEKLNLLKTLGDPLERALAKDPGDLDQILYVYAAVWADHVLWRREPGNPAMLMFLNWMPFAQAHYTAIQRLQTASRRVKAIMAACDSYFDSRDIEAIYSVLLEDISGFFESVGGAIENLGHAFANAIPPVGDGSGLDVIRNRWPRMREAFDRRHQSIHQSIVPVGHDDGILYLDTSLQVEIKTDWMTGKGEKQPVADHFRERWENVKADLLDAWNVLYSHLQTKDQRPQLSNPVWRDTPGPLVSGPPTSPSGTFKPGSGRWI